MMNPSELLLTSSVLILAVLALRHFGRGRLSRRLCYGLWLVVLLRLLVPVSLPSPTSVLNLPAAQSAERFRPLVVSFHDLCGLFQPPGNLF